MTSPAATGKTTAARCPRCGAKLLSRPEGGLICLRCGHGMDALVRELAGPVELPDTAPAQTASGLPPTVPAGAPPGTGALVSEAAALAAILNRFGGKLLASPGAASLDGVSHRARLLSPAGVGLSLLLALAGAEGDTRAGIRRALGLGEKGEVTRESLARAVIALRHALDHLGTGFAFSLGVALWARLKLIFQPDFLELAGGPFRAQIRSLSFMDERAPAAISGWMDEVGGPLASGGTGKLIAPDPLAMLVLTSAARPQGRFAAPFDPARTAESVFIADGGRQMRVPFMAAQGRFNTAEWGGARVAELPFEGGRVSLVLAAPAERAGTGGLSTLLKTLSASGWQPWLERLAPARAAIRLPRFSAACEMDLTGSLTEMGMGDAFDEDRARFDGICPMPPMPYVYLDQARHRASLKVHEQGLGDFVPVTGGDETPPSSPIEARLDGLLPEAEITFDRPFAFMLLDRRTGLALMMGALLAPT